MNGDKTGSARQSPLLFNYSLAALQAKKLNNVLPPFPGFGFISCRWDGHSGLLSHLTKAFKNASKLNTHFKTMHTISLCEYSCTIVHLLNPQSSPDTFLSLRFWHPSAVGAIIKRHLFQVLPLDQNGWGSTATWGQGLQPLEAKPAQLWKVSSSYGWSVWLTDHSMLWKSNTREASGGFVPRQPSFEPGAGQCFMLLLVWVLAISPTQVLCLAGSNQRIQMLDCQASWARSSTLHGVTVHNLKYSPVKPVAPKIMMSWGRLSSAATACMQCPGLSSMWEMLVLQNRERSIQESNILYVGICRHRHVIGMLHIRQGAGVLYSSFWSQMQRSLLGKCSPFACRCSTSPVPCFQRTRSHA